MGYIVIDTNVIIDLNYGGLLSKVFKLPFHLAAPDVIVAELNEPDGQVLEQMGLAACRFNSHQVADVYRLSAIYPRPSRNDLFTLVLAKELRTVLLTGDDALRKAAIQEGIQVRGTLWLLDEMIAQGVISQIEAAASLRKMLENGSRFPKNECEERLQRWTHIA